jgi:hypothetical protein
MSIHQGRSLFGLSNYRDQDKHLQPHRLAVQGVPLNEDALTDAAAAAIASLALDLPGVVLLDFSIAILAAVHTA